MSSLRVSEDNCEDIWSLAYEYLELMRKVY